MLTPEQALDYLGQLSGDIRGAVLIDARGDLVAASAEGRDAELLHDLALEPDAEPPEQVEVSTAIGGVFALRRSGWTLVAAAARFALASLVFLDLRSALSRIGTKAA